VIASLAAEAVDRAVRSTARYDAGVELRELGRNWETLARHDAFWSILTDPSKRRGGWGTDEFFQVGVREIDALLARCRALGRDPKGVALDFGCGVGRLTQALAPHFELVHGVDISPTMIEKARQLNRHGDRCRYIVNQTDKLGTMGDATVDLIYTNIVLQHIERHFMESYLREFLRILKPGALLVFQVPSRIRAPESASCDPRNAVKRLLVRVGVAGLLYRMRLLNTPAVMEMNCFERSELTEFLASHGGDVLATDPSDPGSPIESYVYFVTRA